MNDEMNALEKIQSTNRLFLGAACGIIAAVIWGLWPVITRFGVITDFSPEAIVASRFIFAGVLLIPYYLKNKVFERVSIWRSIILSTAAGGVYVYVSALGLRFVPAGHLGVVETGTMLALSALGGYFFLNEKRGWLQAAGYLLVFAGMLTVNWQSLVFSTDDSLRGDLLLVLGGVLWAIYTIFIKHWGVNSWDAVASVSVWSLIIWVPVIWLFGDFGLTRETLTAWLTQGVAQGVITAVLGLYFYSQAIRYLGAARGSLFGALVPAIAVTGGFVFLSEQPTLFETIGVTLTTTGILLSLQNIDK
jgi:drug/metabolite transporter (DMT)-like permease